MPGRVAGKVALVVGAGSVGPGWGNGKAAAVLYAREGARVFAADRNLAAAEETRAIIAAAGGTARAHAADVTSEADVAAMVAACIAAFGRIDILHNNVGILEMGGPIEQSLEAWRRVMDTNLTGMFLTCKQALPHMLAQRDGAIVNISSVAAVRWLGHSYISYSCSKAGIGALTRSIAARYADQGIRCNAILPGVMRTPMIEVGLRAAYSEAFAGGDFEAMLALRDQRSPTGTMGTGWDTAYAALFLASDEAAYINGIELPVDAGYIARAPDGTLRDWAES
ncbi:MAG: SDR family oxidoreductase [Alphaproteobacteria bacterium]|nr:SDR family oxidoreductase [Alphaproteobacteria bacterium]